VLAAQLDVHYSADVHEKTLCGSNWVVSGSMNFTWRGFEVNEESIVYAVDPELAAQSRLDFEHRWSAR
jgi:phosphatidylserine/phosphatidylglycerophosphate/cardiolipin synthase-like enzyme